MTRRAALRRLASRLAAALAALLLFAVLALVAWQRWGGRWDLGDAREELAAIRSSATMRRRPPPVTAPNDAARRLERAVEDLELGLRLGVDAAPRTGKLAPELDGIVMWLSREVERENSGAPPASLDAILRGRSDRLAALRSAIDEGTDAEWPATPWGADVPIQLIDHLRVARLLLADALSAQRSGNLDRARADMASAWTFQQVLAERPELLAQLIRVVEARLVATVARDVERLPADFVAQLDPEPFREAMRDAVLHEARLAVSDALEAERIAPYEADATPRTAFLPWLLQPVARHAVADGAREAIVIARMLDDDSACGQRLMRVGGTSADGAANLATIVARGDRLAVVFDLSRRVVALKRARDAATPPAWPDVAPEASDGCACVTWAYSRPDPTTARFEAGGWTAWLEDDITTMTTSWSGRL